MDAHGQPFTHPGLVINMSVGGIVIQGVRRKLRIGEILDVQMGQDKAQFKLIWVGEGIRRHRFTARDCSYVRRAFGAHSLFASRGSLLNQELFGLINRDQDPFVQKLPATLICLF